MQELGFSVSTTQPTYGPALETDNKRGLVDLLIRWRTIFSCELELSSAGRIYENNVLPSV